MTQLQYSEGLIQYFQSLFKMETKNLSPHGLNKTRFFFLLCKTEDS